MTGNASVGEAFVQEIVTTIKSNVAALLRSVFKGGFRSLLGGVRGAFLGLFAGVVLALGLGLAYKLAQRMLESGASGEAGNGILFYYVIVGALTGVILGWWYGLKSGFKRALGRNPAIETLVESLTHQVFGFLERNGIIGEQQRQFLRDTQAKIDRKRSDIHETIESSLRKVPLLGGVAARFTSRIEEMVMQVPEALFLKIDLTSKDGEDPQITVRESVLNGLRDTLSRTVDSVFARPVYASAGVAAFLVVLPLAPLVF
jgi:hypothetical protein